MDWPIIFFAILLLHSWFMFRKLNRQIKGLHRFIETDHNRMESLYKKIIKTLKERK